jgi:hypothetical protein
MYRRQPYYLSKVNVEGTLEREEVELPLRGVCFVTYEVEGEAHVEPPGGDGWNEPRYGAYAEVCDVTVLSVEVVDEDGNEWRYDHKFIGPMEPGVVRPNHLLETTDKESERLSEDAVGLAYRDPTYDYDDPRI